MFGNGREFDGPSIPFEVVGYYRTPNNYDVIEQYSSYSSHSLVVDLNIWTLDRSFLDSTFPTLEMRFTTQGNICVLLNFTFQRPFYIFFVTGGTLVAAAMTTLPVLGAGVCELFFWTMMKTFLKCRLEGWLFRPLDRTECTLWTWSRTPSTPSWTRWAGFHSLTLLPLPYFHSHNLQEITCL